MPDQPTDPIVPDHIRAAIHAGHVTQVVIYCDTCRIQYLGDFTGETSTIRIAAARRYLAETQGWTITTNPDRDLCPQCAQAATTTPNHDNPPPPSYQDHAAAILRRKADLGGTDIRAYLHNAGYYDGGPAGERPTEATVQHIAALISTARITVDWPGSTHPTEQTEPLRDAYHRISAELVNRTAERDRLDALLTQAYHHNDTTQEELGSLTAGRDQYRRMEDRIRGLLVTPNGDRDDSDTITVAQLRATINGATWEKHPHKATTPPDGWPIGGQPTEQFRTCTDCGDTIWPEEHAYPAGNTGVRCSICEVRTRRAGLGSSRRAQGSQGYRIVLVDNSGYDAEILMVLPHPYDDRAAAVADRDTVQVHMPSARYAAWEVWSPERLAEHPGHAALAAAPSVSSSRRAQEPRRHAVAFNALSRTLTGVRRFVALSERQILAAAVLAALDADEDGQHNRAADVDQAAIERLLATAREGLAAAEGTADATEIVSELLADWYAAWPDTAVTDPNWPIARELVDMLTRQTAREVVAKADAAPDDTSAAYYAALDIFEGTPEPTAEPTNLEESTSAAARRLAGELERLRLGLLDRNIQPNPGTPVDTGIVDTALTTLDLCTEVLLRASMWRGALDRVSSIMVQEAALVAAVDKALTDWPGMALDIPAVSIAEVHAESVELATGGFIPARGVATVGEAGCVDPLGLAPRIAAQDATAPVDEGHARALSGVIGASNRFAAAARGEQPGDWVRFTAGNGRTYEGWRRPSCPGDGVTGHTHDILCVDVPTVDR